MFKRLAKIKHILYCIVNINVFIFNQQIIKITICSFWFIAIKCKITSKCGGFKLYICIYNDNVLWDKPKSTKCNTKDVTVIFKSLYRDLAHTPRSNKACDKDKRHPDCIPIVLNLFKHCTSPQELYAVPTEKKHLQSDLISSDVTATAFQRRRTLTDSSTCNYVCLLTHKLVSHAWPLILP